MSQPKFVLKQIMRGLLNLDCIFACAAPDGGGEAATCDQVCSISNESSESVGATYWKIPSLKCGQRNLLYKNRLF